VTKRIFVSPRLQPAQNHHARNTRSLSHGVNATSHERETSRFCTILAALSIIRMEKLRYRNCAQWSPMQTTCVSTTPRLPLRQCTSPIHPYQVRIFSLYTLQRVLMYLLDHQGVYIRLCRNPLNIAASDKRLHSHREVLGPCTPRPPPHMTDDLPCEQLSWPGPGCDRGMRRMHAWQPREDADPQTLCWGDMWHLLLATRSRN
jgi:hypothetical protein